MLDRLILAVVDVKTDFVQQVDDLGPGLGVEAAYRKRCVSRKGAKSPRGRFLDLLSEAPFPGVPKQRES